jgi:hypothetical protein
VARRLVAHDGRLVDFCFVNAASALTCGVGSVVQKLARGRNEFTAWAFHVEVPPLKSYPSINRLYGAAVPLLHSLPNTTMSEQLNDVKQLAPETCGSIESTIDSLCYTTTAGKCTTNDSTGIPRIRLLQYQQSHGQPMRLVEIQNTIAEQDQAFGHTKRTTTCAELQASAKAECYTNVLTLYKAAQYEQCRSFENASTMTKGQRRGWVMLMLPCTPTSSLSE